MPDTDDFYGKMMSAFAVEGRKTSVDDDEDEEKFHDGTQFMTYDEDAEAEESEGEDFDENYDDDSKDKAEIDLNRYPVGINPVTGQTSYKRRGEAVNPNAQPMDANFNSAQIKTPNFGKAMIEDSNYSGGNLPEDRNFTQENDSVDGKDLSDNFQEDADTLDYNFTEDDVNAQTNNAEDNKEMDINKLSREFNTKRFSLGEDYDFNSNDYECTEIGCGFKTASPEEMQDHQMAHPSAVEEVNRGYTSSRSSLQTVTKEAYLEDKMSNVNKKFVTGNTDASVDVQGLNGLGNSGKNLAKENLIDYSNQPSHGVAFKCNCGAMIGEANYTQHMAEAHGDTYNTLGEVKIPTTTIIATPDDDVEVGQNPDYNHDLNDHRVLVRKGELSTVREVDNPANEVDNMVCDDCNIEFEDDADAYDHNYDKHPEKMSHGNATEVEQEEVSQYLDELRDSGQTNMFGAGQYVEDEFGISKQEARAFLTHWMTNFGKESRVKGTEAPFTSHNSSFHRYASGDLEEEVSSADWECPDCGEEITQLYGGPGQDKIVDHLKGHGYTQDQANDIQYNEKEDYWGEARASEDRQIEDAKLNLLYAIYQEALQKYDDYEENTNPDKYDVNKSFRLQTKMTDARGKYRKYKDKVMYGIGESRASEASHYTCEDCDATFGFSASSGRHEAETGHNVRDTHSNKSTEARASEAKVKGYCNMCGFETWREEGQDCPYHQKVLDDGTFLYDEFDQNGESFSQEMTDEDAYAKILLDAEDDVLKKTVYKKGVDETFGENLSEDEEEELEKLRHKARISDYGLSEDELRRKDELISYKQKGVDESLTCANCDRTIVQSDTPNHLGICSDCSNNNSWDELSDATAKIDAERADKNHPFNVGLLKNSKGVEAKDCKYCSGTGTATVPLTFKTDGSTSTDEEYPCPDCSGTGNESFANEIDGDYIYDGQVIGRVTDLKPDQWFGRVELSNMPGMAEYGTLDPSAQVRGDDGQTYSDPEGGGGTLLDGSSTGGQAPWLDSEESFANEMDDAEFKAYQDKEREEFMTNPVVGQDGKTNKERFDELLGMLEAQGITPNGNEAIEPQMGEQPQVGAEPMESQQPPQIGMAQPEPQVNAGDYVGEPIGSASINKCMGCGGLGEVIGSSGPEKCPACGGSGHFLVGEAYAYGGNLGLAAEMDMPLDSNQEETDMEYLDNFSTVGPKKEVDQLATIEASINANNPTQTPATETYSRNYAQEMGDGATNTSLTQNNVLDINQAIGAAEMFAMSNAEFAALRR